MFTLPPLPGPEGQHVLVVHFPVALLMATPAFLVLGFLLPKRGGAFRAAALLLMAMGTLGALAAVATGHDAERVARAVPGTHDTLERHEELGHLTRNVFLGLTGVYAVIALATAKAKYGLRAAVHVLFLVGYAFGCLKLAQTAHEGGTLVHEHGVRAWTAPPAGGGGGDDHGRGGGADDDDDHEHGRDGGGDDEDD